MKNNAAFIHKFGGSSLADPSAFLRVARLILSQSDRVTQGRTFVVVSARYGLTNTLHRLVEKATQGKPFSVELESLHHAQRSFVRALYAVEGTSKKSDLRVELSHLGLDVRCIEENLIELRISGFVDACYNTVIGYGEIWSARLLSVALGSLVEPGIMRSRNVDWINARAFLFGKRKSRSVDIDMPRSKCLLEHIIQGSVARFWVVTGYISSSHEGGLTNLGRNGSDYTAALITALLDAKAMTIWSDVNGILNIDPDLKIHAEVLPRVSYREASELAQLGAGVLHPNTLSPLQYKSAVLSLRNSLNIEQKGTCIERSVPHSMGIATGLSDVRILSFNYSGRFDFSVLVEKSPVSWLAMSQNNGRVYLACRFSELSEAFCHAPGSVNDITSTGLMDVLPVPCEVTTASLLGWVSHDIVLSSDKREIWDRVMRQTGDDLIFQSTHPDALLAFIRRSDHRPATCLLHREMVREKEKLLAKTG